MKEQLISFETAKLAKEKGFNLECKCFYTNPRSKMFGIDEHNNYYPIKNIFKKIYTIGFEATLNSKNVIYSPTQSLLQKWLREKHNIDVEIHREGPIQSQRDGFSLWIMSLYETIFPWKLGGIHNTYEEALEKGLQEALKLIEK